MEEYGAIGTSYRYITIAIWIAAVGTLYILISKEPPPKSEAKLETSPSAEKVIDPRIFKDFWVWCWLIGTCCWALIFTVPLSMGKDLITQNFEYQISENKTEKMTNAEAAEVMMGNGFCELAVRFVIVFFGKYLPNSQGDHALMYGVSCALTGLLCLWVTSQSAPWAAWVFFLALTVPIGFMNGMIYGSTENIFTPRRIRSVWPFTNVFLAIGFTLGPIMCALVGESTGNSKSGIYVCAFISFVGAGIMLFLGVKTKSRAAGVA